MAQNWKGPKSLQELKNGRNIWEEKSIDQYQTRDWNYNVFCPWHLMIRVLAQVGGSMLLEDS